MSPAFPGTTASNVGAQLELSRGTLGWTLSRAVPLIDESGEIIEWVGTATEIPPP